MSLTQKHLDALKDEGYTLRDNIFRNSKDRVVAKQEDGKPTLHYNSSEPPIRMELTLDFKDALDKIGIKYDEGPSTAGRTAIKKAHRWLKIAERINRRSPRNDEYP